MSNLMAGAIGFVSGVVFSVIVRVLWQRFVNRLSGAIFGWGK